MTIDAARSLDFRKRFIKSRIITEGAVEQVKPNFRGISYIPIRRDILCSIKIETETDVDIYDSIYRRYSLYYGVNKAGTPYQQSVATQNTESNLIGYIGNKGFYAEFIRNVYANFSVDFVLNGVIDFDPIWKITPLALNNIQIKNENLTPNNLPIYFLGEAGQLGWSYYYAAQYSNYYAYTLKLDELFLEVLIDQWGEPFTINIYTIISGTRRDLVTKIYYSNTQNVGESLDTDPRIIDRNIVLFAVNYYGNQVNINSTVLVNGVLGTITSLNVPISDQNKYALRPEVLNYSISNKVINAPNKILDYWNPVLEQDGYKFTIDTDNVVW